ncbi:uncharacterized protein N7477_005884 [Penicillium maclennaniae]|uniref:uncharacterized protein n=1 Tax=Penicillium maclennaniae TaxID=1343394 RepID=UPI00254034A8|nr:uncharacterized protein N7477_005884 [Penicillium maclennaniae]KAJ5670521.1 hypothetical protein N7477_005884 [Penicillium maclennaniae]
MVTITSPRAVAFGRSQMNSVRERIERVTEDLNDIKTFLPIGISGLRLLQQQPFEYYDQQEKVDYLLIKNYLERQLRDLELDIKQDKKATPLLPFADTLVNLCEDRALVVPIDPEDVAQKLCEVDGQITTIIARIKAGSKDVLMEKTSAFRASKTTDSLRSHLKEWYGFYKGYDPSFDWWVSQPYSMVDKKLEIASDVIRERLVGIDPGNEDAIVGDPIGREGVISELRAEVIPYTPEEVIAIGEKEFQWCIKELKKASQTMGLQDKWKEALEQVKNDYVEPGQQTQLVLDLVEEAVSFVKEHDMITVPLIAKETWQLFMMSPKLFYPVDTMDHGAKLMSMRGNIIHFSRATVFHEMIPGHHLQMHMNARHKPHRRLFDTPFWIEGWSLYWEFILWDDERFAKTPRNRIGMLFWRLHRCARIIFSVKFHLGQMAPQECIDLLVNEVGHERATAEGGVRRSLNGDYSPLYQAGYMLGALQIYALRKEVVDTHYMAEKVFHDRFLQENRMPIELVRALILNQPLSRDYQASWRFY